MMRSSWIILFIMELVSLFNPVLCFVTNRMPRGSCCIRFMNEDTDKNVDVDNVKPPPSFDPSIFDQFDLGGWSTNPNNPFVAAAYVKARQSMDKAKNRKNTSENSSNSRRVSSSTSTDPGNNEKETILQRLMTRDEQAILERRKAWERARAEEND